MNTLLPSAELFHLEATTYQAGRLILRLRTRRQYAACPTCQTLSNKIHSHYSRHLADLPWAGMPVQFDLQVRKFFCRNEACRQQIFCERLAEVALASARQTVRLNSYLQQCGWHLGGELSVRLTRLTGVRLGADAILQRVRKLQAQRVPPTASEYMRTRAQQAARQDFHQRRKARYDEIKQLQAEGRSILETARSVGMSYMAVKRFYEAPTYPLINRARRGSQLDSFLPYLQQRWAEGCRNAKQLAQEIQSQGYGGSNVTVRRLLIPWRINDSSAPVPLPIPKWRTPSPKECLWWVLKEEKKLTEEQQQFRALLLERSPPIRQGRELVQAFRTVLAKRQAAALADGETKVRASELKEFGTFLTGLQRDRAAVENAISQSWSNGPVEGQVNRLKNIKRSMFGRANFDLLKARVINA